MNGNRYTGLHGQDTRRANRLLLFLSLSYFLLEWIPGFIGEYGYFIDELYYLACADHLAMGYVDHPPVSIYGLWLVRSVIGDSLPALCLVPALAGGVTIFIIGIIARRLGTDLFGQAIAAGAAMAGLIYQVTFSFYSMNAFSILLWAVSFLVLVEIERRDEPRLWILFGILLGIGLENKHTFILLPVGLAAGLLFTPARGHLRTRWFWIGCAIAVALLVPNLAWQASNGRPSIEFYQNADFYKNVPTPPLEVLIWQFITMNPGAAPIWLCGLGFFLFTFAGSRYRHLGIISLVLLALMLVGQKSRPDRIAESYIILFAGGGVLVSSWFGMEQLRKLRWTVPVALILFSAWLTPMGVPVLPPDRMAEYAAGLGMSP